VQDECNLVVDRMSLTRAIVCLESGQEIRKKGRPKLFPLNLEDILKERLET
jgi:hypothetical protein